MAGYHALALEDALRRLAQFPTYGACVSAAIEDVPTVVTQLRHTVLSEVPQFSESRNPDLLPELARHGEEIVEEIVRLMRGGRIGDFDFVREHARRRAIQRFPLEATLHAYRSGHKVLSRWLRDIVLGASSSKARAAELGGAIADFSMEYVDAISTTFAGSYTSYALAQAELEEDRRSELLRILLDGYDESNPRAGRLLREAGFLDERQFFCVALAQSLDPTEMLDARRARRMADAIEKLVANLSVRRVIGLHDHKVTLVCAAVSRDSGWTAPRASLAERIRVALNFVGNAALIGVSNDAPSTSHIRSAHHEALTALNLASVSERVMQFSQIPVRRLMLHFAVSDLRQVLPQWANVFYAADDKAEGALSATLHAYARFDMNILKAAEELRVHANTIYARLQRIQDITGLQARSFHGLSDLLVACDCRT